MNLLTCRIRREKAKKRKKDDDNDADADCTPPGFPSITIIIIIMIPDVFVCACVWSLVNAQTERRSALTTLSAISCNSMPKRHGEREHHDPDDVGKSDMGWRVWTRSAKSQKIKKKFSGNAVRD